MGNKPVKLNFKNLLLRVLQGVLRKSSSLNFRKRHSKAYVLESSFSKAAGSFSKSSSL